MIDLALIMVCAPNVAPSTIQEIIRVESAGNPLAVNINTRNGVKLRPTIKITTAQHAIAVTYAAMAPILPSWATLLRICSIPA